MGTRLRKSSFRRETPSKRSSWALQPVSRIVGQRPLEFVRRKTWISKPARLANGISAVTSLCLCDEASTGGPSLLISGDEDGGVSVSKVEGGGDEESPSSGRRVTPELRRVRLHSSCVNTIKVLPDQRGYVCAGDDGALTAVASFEASSEAEIRRAALHLTGHSGFVTDCDAARTGHGILSSSTDGRMLLWDPVSANTPVASVFVGRPVNSACFSAGDPYALICAPELGEARSSRGGGSGGGGSSSSGSEDLVQIWDLRFLRCFKDSIPAALAAAFGEETPASMCPPQQPASMQPPPPQSPQAWPSSIWSSSAGSATTSRSSAARTPGEVPSWLTTVLGSTSAASPATPLLRRSAWTDDSSDAESSEKRWHRDRGCSLWSPGGAPGSIGKENTFPSGSSTCSCSPASAPRGGGEYATTPGSSARERGASRPARKVAAQMRDGPAAVLCLASLPACGCLHRGKGKTWVPGGLKTWQASSRRARTAEARERAGVACAACPRTAEAASAFSVQASVDGRLIMVASRDRTVTLFDAQSREVVCRFGSPTLSTRARPILVGGDSGGGGGGWGRGRGGGGRGDVFCGMMEGEVRCWRVGSQFPNRVFKPAGHHEGFEVCCLATSKSGDTFASADSSGTVCVQSAPSGRQDEERASSGRPAAAVGDTRRHFE